jgi:hypothetical protein
MVRRDCKKTRPPLAKISERGKTLRKLQSKDIEYSCHSERSVAE